MTDFTDGQKAIIQSIVNDSFEKKISKLTDQMNDISDDAIDAEREKLDDKIIEVSKIEIAKYHSSLPPVWMFWKRKDSASALAIALLGVLAFLYDRDDGKLFLHSILHNTIGTHKVIANEISDVDSNINGLLNLHLENNLDNKNSNANKYISESMASFVNDTDRPDNPIKKTVQRMLDENPILIFQSEAVFGEIQQVTVINHTCAISQVKPETVPINPETGEKNIEVMDIKQCESTGALPTTDRMNVPFYGKFYRDNGSDGHEVYLLLRVVRTTKNTANQANYLSSYGLTGVQVEMIRTKNSSPKPLHDQSISENPNVITVKHEDLRELDSIYFYADLGKLYRAKYQFEDGVDLFPSFLHTVTIEINSEHLEEVDEIMGLRALVLVNRKPNQE